MLPFTTAIEPESETYTNITLLSRQRRAKHVKKYNEINGRKTQQRKYRWHVKSQQYIAEYIVDLSKHKNNWQKISLTCQNTKTNDRQFVVWVYVANITVASQILRNAY